MKKLYPQAQHPDRVVVLGAGGFIGSHIVQACGIDGVEVLPLSRKELDLTQPSSIGALRAILQPNDVVLFLSTLTPRYGKGVDAFVQNIRIGQHVVEALRQVPIAHLIYLSSDAVYAFQQEPVHEKTPPSPQDLYGCMHRARELMVETLAPLPIALLRATLVYGVGDPHNSYGPNRMIRTAHENHKIALFGNGEERRDHIHIDDVIRLIQLSIYHRVTGILNLVTGDSVSYHSLATLLLKYIPEAHVEPSERRTPITHRSFDNSLQNVIFPTFAPIPLETGLQRYITSVTLVG